MKNLQYIISYFGLIPYIYLLIDKYLFLNIEEEILYNFILYYTLIISVFIGSINWNLQSKVPNHLIIYGFIPTVYSLILIILNLYSYNIKILFLLSIILLISQLFFDFILIFANLKNKKVFYFLRLPLTILISLILIILVF
jgi:hypothetical protein|tara:strand:- start:102 stop:524 length:423 start_codon:yes stop_codon:yes gene_type:complete